MVSHVLIRRYPFFSGINDDYLATLAKAAQEVSVEAGHYFFREGDELGTLYLLLEGAVAIIIEVPDRNVQPTVEQIAGKLVTKDITVSTVGTGDVFAWSALVPPHKSTANAKAITPCRVVGFDMAELRPIFEKDHYFAYLMILRAAQVIRDRLRDTRIELLAEAVA